MATEVEQLYLQLELINIEEKMLKLQMMKRRLQRRRSLWWSVRPAEAGNGGIYNTGCELTAVNLQPGWTDALSIISNVNELLRRIQPLRPEKQLLEIKFWADQSQPSSTWRVVRIFWRSTSGYGGGVVKMALKHKLRLTERNWGKCLLIGWNSAVGERMLVTLNSQSGLHW